ncbi:hypothetical protein ABE10_00985 [Bacillus toyonensis]|nr:hypothetical protein [Bacillus toyonensis]
MVAEVPLPALVLPGEPGERRVVTVGVVVAVLGAAGLVAGGEHRDAGGEEKRPQEVAHRLPARRLDHRIVGGTLGAMVESAVHLRAVAVLLAVGLVVLDVVRDEVAQGEPVVRGDEVHARERSPLG